MNQIRQGDVLLKRTDGVDLANAQRIEAERGRLVLARGEATGHNHTVCADVAELFRVSQGMILVVAEPTTIEHQEHGAIEIQPGEYWVVPQREYDGEEERRVRD